MKVRLLTVFILVMSFALVISWSVAAQGEIDPKGWVQSNASGFGEANNTDISALASFKGQLYAGTSSFIGGQAQLWQWGNMGWTAVMTDGFGNVNNQGIDHLFQFNDQFYAGTWNETDGGEIWRSSNGLAWTQVISQGFGDMTNGEVFRFIVFSNTLYASTVSFTSHGTEIWRSSTGNSLDWTRVVANGFNNDANNIGAVSFEVFNDYLYAGTFNSTTGGEIWRTANGTTWTQVNADGFSVADNQGISALAIFSSTLYASTVGATANGFGSQVWRCQVCNGSDWTKVVDNGFGNGETGKINALEVFSNHLFFVAGNAATGMEVWHTQNGLDWTQVNTGGFGDPANRSSFWDNSVTVFDNNLYVGTSTLTGRGEIWLFLDQRIYLPLIVRN